MIVLKVVISLLIISIPFWILSAWIFGNARY